MIKDETCFISKQGVVFDFVILKELDSLIIEYADDIDAANKGIFYDGDQFDINQNFDSLVKEMKEELSIETKRTAA